MNERRMWAPVYHVWDLSLIAFSYLQCQPSSLRLDIQLMSINLIRFATLSLDSARESILQAYSIDSSAAKPQSIKQPPATHKRSTYVFKKLPPSILPFRCISSGTSWVVTVIGTIGAFLFEKWVKQPFCLHFFLLETSANNCTRIFPISRSGCLKKCFSESSEGPFSKVFSLVNSAVPEKLMGQLWWCWSSFMVLIIRSMLLLLLLKEIWKYGNSIKSPIQNSPGVLQTCCKSALFTPTWEKAEPGCRHALAQQGLVHVLLCPTR